MSGIGSEADLIREKADMAVRMSTVRGRPEVDQERRNVRL